MKCTFTKTAAVAAVLVLAGCGGTQQVSSPVTHGSGTSSGTSISGVSDQAWGPTECHPLTGANPSLEQARAIYNEHIHQGRPEAPPYPDDALDDLTRVHPKHVELPAGIVGGGFEYADIKPGGVAWATAQRCFRLAQTGAEYGGNTDGSPWNQVDLVGWTLWNTLRTCDDAKASGVGPLDQKPTTMFDINLIMHTCPQLVGQRDQAKFWRWVDFERTQPTPDFYIGQ